MSEEDFIICELPNGRRYKVFDSKTPYKGGEYPSGGFVIWTELKGQWYFVSHAPDLECLHNFLNAAKRNAPDERQTHEENIKTGVIPLS